MRPLLLCLCLIFSAVSVRAETLKIIAVDYPPFTTSKREDSGTVFALIRQWLIENGSDISVQPVFDPPARAQVMIEAGNWCASLYPPVKNTGHFLQISNRSVDIGFLRRRVEAAFTWDGPGFFAGKKVAVLRARTTSGLLGPLKEAGADFIDVETVQQGIRLLMAGRVDYAFADHLALSRFPAASDERLSLEFSKTILRRYPIGLFVSDRCIHHFPNAARGEKRPNKEGAAG